MEILSFAFGMLSMIGLLFAISIVVGIVKVLKQQNQLEGLEQWIRSLSGELDRRFENLERELEIKLNDTNSAISSNYDSNISYIDSRLDKLEQKLTSTTSAKQVIKG